MSGAGPREYRTSRHHTVVPAQRRKTRYNRSVETPELLRFLELVREEVGAADARYELGGQPPNDSRVTSQALDEEWRLVVAFTAPISDRSAVDKMLERLVSPFVALLRSVTVVKQPVQLDRGTTRPAAAQARLDRALAQLADRAGASCSLVIDDRSPMLWGPGTIRRVIIDVETAIIDASLLKKLDGSPEPTSRGRFVRDTMRERLDALGLQPAETVEADAQISRWFDAEQVAPGWVQTCLLAATAIDALRGPANAHLRPVEDTLRRVIHRENFGCLARRFANQYWLCLVFSGEFSELRAEAQAIRAAPLIEALVHHLPPVEPDSGGKSKASSLRLV